MKIIIVDERNEINPKVVTVIEHEKEWDTKDPLRRKDYF
jgi:hypothetical protein